LAADDNGDSGDGDDTADMDYGDGRDPDSLDGEMVGEGIGTTGEELSSGFRRNPP
jgi:hypothetical protein